MSGKGCVLVFVDSYKVIKDVFSSVSYEDSF